MRKIYQTYSSKYGRPPSIFFAVVGGNGTGKSTMLKAICNVREPYRGKVLVNGEKLRSINRMSRHIFKKAMTNEEVIEL
ncbi:ATP-binding cassette domain-containing protein [Christensenella tenuis]|jgi:ABC-type cobalamin/Fe3+-siderophores transport system ATPase subunit|uniref:ATP-binding cassette domain-containing protein n=1 Tax=Christensenella tenuis TaxID=2763033 RepID=A0ABR7EAU8_9FIRM|nr:ABC transporter ATP-binding protein [Christensenella tenuis]MBC5646900.1 ATP-binding cassette domain-containing protein [Christensenella tenuis]